MHEEQEEHRDSEETFQAVITPVEQESILFHGEEIVAVRLADGRICVVIRWVAESLKLKPGSQVRKIRSTPSTANELVRVIVQTKGGPQRMPAITLKGFPVWMLTMNPNETQDEHLRELILAYQEEAKDVLYHHFLQKSRQHALPEPSLAQAVVPAEQVKPAEPQGDASHDEWISYYQQMIRWHHWQKDIEQWRGSVEIWQTTMEEWRGSVESRLESMEEVVRSVLPSIPRPTLSTEQQTSVRGMVKRLSDLSGVPYQTIYWELAQAFQAPRYAEIPADHYEAICEWFRRRIEAAKKRPRGKA